MRNSFFIKNLKPVAYNEVNGIRDVLNKLCSTIGSKAIPIMEGTNIIGLTDGEGVRYLWNRVANSSCLAHPHQSPSNMF